MVIMKTLLLLGGSNQQIIAIKRAKELGLRTVLCDYLPDNPGQNFADVYYNVSTTDPEAILEVAQKENIDGIIAYASDPAAPTAAYVAEKMNLAGNKYDSVKILCNKDLLRTFLAENGFNYPKTFETVSAEDFPVIVKPVDSSGSKGVTVVYDNEKLGSAIEKAKSFSRCGRIIIEKYVEKAHKYIIGGDIIVENGEIAIDGLMNCHRDARVNPLVPVGKSYPLDVTNEQHNAALDMLARLVKILEIKNAAMNVELVVDEKGECYLLDAGPRSGGNMIPDLLGMIFGVDIVEICIKHVMGEDDAAKKALAGANPECIPGRRFYSTYNLHADRNGFLRNIDFSAEIGNFIVKQCIYAEPDSEAEYFDYSSKALGIIFLKFDSLQKQRKIMENINNHVRVDVAEREIGGYFGLEQQYIIDTDTEKTPWKSPGIPRYSFNLARTALIALLTARNAKKIWIPYLLCDSVSDALSAAGIPFEYYDGEFSGKLGAGEYLYVVNFYGQLTNYKISELIKRYSRVIIDNAQAYFQPPVKGGDTIYSCRKFFGVPDGAFLFTDAKITRPAPADGEVPPYLTGRLKDGATAHYNEFKNQSLYNKTAPIAVASALTKELLDNIDYEEVRERREENYAILSEELDEINGLSLRAPVGPFAYPFYTENSAELRKKLADNGIYVPVLWPNCKDSGSDSAADLSEHILPLPCDQRYGEEEMYKIADIILEE